jgi:hypothetical protein
MPYSNFTLETLKSKFDIVIKQERDFFTDVSPVEVSQLLRDTLKENVPLAVAIGTEKARSEMMIAPVLIEVRRLLNHQVSLFSGVEFNVDQERELRGVCDFIISLSPEQLTINAPVITIVEAKNENIKSGLAQCIAEMIAAQVFNQQQRNQVIAVYGAVTTGSVWQFLRLEEQIVEIDLSEYYLKEVDRIAGILLTIVNEAGKV